VYMAAEMQVKRPEGIAIQRGQFTPLPACTSLCANKHKTNNTHARNCGIRATLEVGNERRCAFEASAYLNAPSLCG